MEGKPTVFTNELQLSCARKKEGGDGFMDSRVKSWNKGSCEVWQG